jgi:uncharacterized protein
MRINKVSKYIQECLRLLYWMYFKPYTFAKWLLDVHPGLQPHTHPLSLRSEFGENPRLKSYADRVWWLTAIAPSLAVLIIAPIYSLFVDPSFDWLRSEVCLAGWIFGIWLRGEDSTRLRKRARIIPVIIVLTISIWVVSLITIPNQLTELYRNVSCHSSSIFFLIASFLIMFIFSFGRRIDQKRNTVFDVAFGATFVATQGVKGLTFYILQGIGFGIAFNSELYKTETKLFPGLLYSLAISILGSMHEKNIEIVIFQTTAFDVFYIFGVFRVYSWASELIWMLGLKLLTYHRKAVSLLFKLPPYFDQLIILPLPFMADIIIKAHRQNPIAARSTIDYFITFTNQQTVAKKAMFGIGVDTLNQCCHPSDIVGAATQLDWLPTNEKTFGSVFPRLLEISHDIGTAYQATSPYRRLELVDRSILDLQKLQTSLSTATSASDAPQFGTITTRWLQILNDNRQALAIAAQQSSEIPNPYLAGSSLEPADAKERFKGRQDLFRAIEDISLSAQPPVLLLYGRRRTGKTSTLKYLPSRVSSDLIPLLVDFQGAASIQRMENIAEFIATAIVKTAKSARNLNLPTLSPAQLSNDPFYALQTWMEQIERDAPGRRFLLCIDEFERLEEVIATSGSRAPLNFLRYVMQNRRQWIVLFSGSHRLDELQPYWSDYLIGTRTLPITYLQPAEARELVQHPVPNFPDIYAPAAVDEILRLTRGQPYLVQLLCSCVVEYINSADVQRQLVTVADVDAAKPIAWERGKPYFLEFWVDLKTEKQDFLGRLLAQSSIQESDRTLIKQLIQSEVIEADANGEYQFQVPLIEQYLQQNYR